jgi:hypothetical protein
MERAMSSRQNESILPSLLFVWAWWKLSDYPHVGGYAFFAAIALWFVGWIAIRMFSSAVHRLGFWGWVLLIEVTAWYSAALWKAPVHTVDLIFLLWGVATPLLFAGHVWRRGHARFPRLQGVMHVMAVLALAASFVSTPVFAWQAGPDLGPQFLAAVGFAASGWLCLWYGWRLAAPPPSGEYDARLGTVDGFQRRGVSYER